MNVRSLEEHIVRKAITQSLSPKNSTFRQVSTQYAIDVHYENVSRQSLNDDFSQTNQIEDIDKVVFAGRYQN